MTPEEQNQTPVTSGAEVAAVAGKERTDVGKILFGIKTTIVDLTNAAARVFHQLSEKEQLFAGWASGVIAVINANLDKTPDAIFALIQALYPTISKEYIQGKLVVLSNKITLFNNLFVTSVDEAIVNLQKFLSLYEGNDWQAETKRLVLFLFNILSPDSTLLEKVAYGLEWLYNHVIKPKLVLLLAA